MLRKMILTLRDCPHQPVAPVTATDCCCDYEQPALPSSSKKRKRKGSNSAEKPSQDTFTQKTSARVQVSSTFVINSRNMPPDWEEADVEHEQDGAR
jgi:hypothetical protein